MQFTIALSRFIKAKQTMQLFSQPTSTSVRASFFVGLVLLMVSSCLLLMSSDRVRQIWVLGEVIMGVSLYLLFIRSTLPVIFTWYLKNVDRTKPELHRDSLALGFVIFRRIFLIKD